jgi:hypothetical protein
MESSIKSLLFGVVLLGAAGAFVARKQITQLFKKHSAVLKGGASGLGDGSLVQGGDIVVEAGGKPYVSEEAFNKKLQQLLKSSAYTREMDSETFPAEAKSKFLKDWVNFLLIKDVWGKERNIEQDEEFKKRCEESFEAVRDSLIIDTFVQSLKDGITVSDDDVAVEYNSNKENYLKSRGGSRFAVAQFAKISEAQEFKEQLSGLTEVKDFMVLAEHLNGMPVDLGYIDGKGSSLNAAISKYPIEVRRLLVAREVAPVSLVEDDGVAYVVFATEKKPATYYELDEIHTKIKALLEENLHKAALEKALSEMTQKANIVVHEEVFAKKNQKQKPRIMNKQELQSFNEELEEEESAEDDELKSHVH